MCGITGWVGRDVGEPTLRRMTQALAHRGPDGDGHAIITLPDNTSIGLGHRRLSIIDLAGGTQPMNSHDGRFCIVFNGEIYNYVEVRAELVAGGAHFDTASDTEVILEAWRAWGTAALSRLRGMFAFSLFDHAEGTLFLARDPFGKKPMFLARGQARGGETLVYGSEIPSLLAHPDVTTDLDEAALHDFLVWRYVPSPNTLFRGIEKLPPGSVLRWQAGQVTIEQFWQAPEERDPPHDPAPEDPIQAFLDVFDESVRIRLRSDVPVGSFLSSGLDSTAIVATMLHLGASDVRTFSVGFRGDPSSELPAAEETAQLLGTRHTSLELDTDDIFRWLPQLSRQRGAPVTEPADLPIYLMSAEAAKYVKVVMSGEGADEIFAGYPKHLMEAHGGWAAKAGVLPVAGHAMSLAARVMAERGRRLQVASRALKAGAFEDRMVRWFGALSSADRARLWSGAVPEHHRPVSNRPFRAASGASGLRRVLHFDQTSWLPDNLLERMDMMTMAASIEARTPFMDVELAAFSTRLPDHWRIKGRTTKRIVREALRPRIPQAVIDRRKNGFRLPVSQWFRGPLREPFQDLVLGADAVSGAYLDQAELRRYFDEHQRGVADHDKTLWSLFALETCLREMRQPHG